jgi:DNA adenine methylase
MKPILKWVGGKSWLVPALLPLVGKRPIIELFAGGAALSLHQDTVAYILNDMNEDLIDFYKGLKNDDEYTLNDELYFQSANTEATYYVMRDKFNKTPKQTLSRRKYFYYLNKTGYHGLWRVNRKGEFNVPFGFYKNIDFTIDQRGFKDQGIMRLLSMDFQQVSVAPDCVVYADPPYHTTFDGYTSTGFSWDDQQRLAHHLAQLPHVIASNSWSQGVIDLYVSLGFSVRQVYRTRGINAAPEALFTKGV